MNKEGADVVVIGGGVIGTSVAYYLAKGGADVLLVEKGRLGNGSSSGCDGFVIMQSKTPGPHLDMALASEVLYRTLADELEWDIEYRRCGGMIVIEREEEIEAMKIFMAKQRSIGLDVRLLSGDEARELEPALARHIAGATVSDSDAQVNPMQLLFGYAHGAERHGARLRRNAPVTEILHDGGGNVTGVVAAGRTVRAGAVVCCTGVDTAALVAPLGLELPITPRRGQLLITEPVEPLIGHVMLCARYIAAKYHPELLEGSQDETVRLGVGLALEQTREGGLLIGSTREFAGFDRSNTSLGTWAVAAHATRIVPSLRQIRVVRTFAGLRPYTPDGKAFMGEAPRHRGLFIAAGHEGDGIAYSPITGKTMAERIMTGKSAIDLAPFAVDRFSR